MEILTETQLKLIVTCAGALIENATEAKMYFELNSYDELAVILAIISLTKGKGGVPEREISDYLDIPRATLNRMLRTLVNSGQLRREERNRKYYYGYETNYAFKKHKSDAGVYRLNLLEKLIKRNALLSSELISIAAESQYEIK